MRVEEYAHFEILNNHAVGCYQATEFRGRISRTDKKKSSSDHSNCQSTMVKAYLRYEPLASFGVIASAQGNVLYDSTGKYALSPALESVCLWDLKKGLQVCWWIDREMKKLQDETYLLCVCVCNGFQHGTWKESDIKAEVTCIAKSPDGKNYAVG